jgi:hypothetical protein
VGCASGVTAGSGVELPSTLMCGSRRSSGWGSHQFALPSSSIVAGTSMSRTIVASTNTATARPSPIIFTVGSGLVTNERNTAIMINAAEVITRAVLARPIATASRLLPDARYSSRMRDSRNTS